MILFIQSVNAAIMERFDVALFSVFPTNALTGMHLLSKDRHNNSMLQVHTILDHTLLEFLGLARNKDVYSELPIFLVI